MVFGRRRAVFDPRSPPGQSPANPPVDPLRRPQNAPASGGKTRDMQAALHGQLGRGPAQLCPVYRYGVGFRGAGLWSSRLLVTGGQTSLSNNINMFLIQERNVVLGPWSLVLGPSSLVHWEDRWRTGSQEQWTKDQLCPVYR